MGHKPIYPKQEKWDYFSCHLTAATRKCYIVIVIESVTKVENN